MTDGRSSTRSGVVPIVNEMRDPQPPPQFANHMDTRSIRPDSLVANRGASRWSDRAQSAIASPSLTRISDSPTVLHCERLVWRHNCTLRSNTDLYGARSRGRGRFLCGGLGMIMALHIFTRSERATALAAASLNSTTGARRLCRKDFSRLRCGAILLSLRPPNPRL